MRFVMFYHSLVSDWNHGNAHFLRGVVSELLVRGHKVDIYEPRNGWSLTNLLSDQGDASLISFKRYYPELLSRCYDAAALDVDEAIGGADVVIVHEWNEPRLVQRVGEHRRRVGGYKLLFHDTHHRSVTDPESIAKYDLTGYDGVLAFGNVIRDLYLRNSWAERAWTWHEAADTRVFRPLPASQHLCDLVWIGNWGDEERTQELSDYLIEPINELKLEATVYGVRYPAEGIQALAEANIDYKGWLPNFRVPEEFARHRATLHIPRKPYREKLSGIPTIRVFEALACGIPLISLAWDDSEHLFDTGSDYLVANNKREMKNHISDVLHDKQLARSLAQHGRKTVERRHTCAHRVEELLEICSELGVNQVERESLAQPHGLPF